MSGNVVRRRSATGVLVVLQVCYRCACCATGDRWLSTDETADVRGERSCLEIPLLPLGTEESESFLLMSYLFGVAC